MTVMTDHLRAHWDERHDDRYRWWVKLSSGSEWVVLVRDRQMREACIDLRTGAVRKWGERI